MIRSSSKLGPFWENEQGSFPPQAWTASDLSRRLGGKGSGHLGPPSGEPTHEERLKSAFLEGFERGREAGVSQTVQELEDAILSLRAAAQTVRDQVEHRANATEENLRALVVTVARHLLDRELATDVDEISKLVSRALAQFPLDEPVRLRLNPIDLSMISATVAEKGEEVSLTDGRDVEWIPDQRIARGGFLVEGKERLVDAQLDRALERVYRELGDA